jgi:putative redox protein
MKPPAVVHVTWDGDYRFDVGRPDRPTSRIDAGGVTGPGPVDMFLGALASCAAVDVVDILAKRRTPVERLSMTVTGDRSGAIPARVTRVLLDYRLDGAGIDRPSAERAIHLAVSKYCSVRSSIDPAIPIAFSVTLNGEPGVPITTGPRAETPPPL